MFFYFAAPRNFFVVADLIKAKIHYSQVGEPEIDQGLAQARRRI
jgi:hypothetical protein